MRFNEVVNVKMIKIVIKCDHEEKGVGRGWSIIGEECRAREWWRRRIE